MAVKILIKRRVPEGKEKEMLLLLSQLRNLGVNQPGYISGETLKSVENPGEYVVISTWQSLDDWHKWADSSHRVEIQSQIDYLLGEETEYGVYSNP